jgi:thiamine-monophosphate kinase
MANSNSRPDEFSLIATLFAPLAGEGAFGLKDDAAVIAPSGGHELVVTTDTIIEGVDFFPDDPADTVAKKALRVNLSDLAAKGTCPRAYLLTLALPEKAGMEWLEDFARGLKQDQAEFGIALLGGDMSATPGPLSISVTAFGEVPVGKMIRRNGAREGDNVYVTGTIGDSGGGLFQRRGAVASSDLVQRYRVPVPRVSFGKFLLGLASAALDVSDGLIADASHIAETSNVHLALDADRIPLSEALWNLWGAETVLRAATSGDDYEILFTAPQRCEGEISAIAKKGDTRVTRIGTVKSGAGVSLLDEKGVEIPILRPGYRHF